LFFHYSRTISTRGNASLLLNPAPKLHETASSAGLEPTIIAIFPHPALFVKCNIMGIQHFPQKNSISGLTGLVNFASTDHGPTIGNLIVTHQGENIITFLFSRVEQILCQKNV